MPLKHIPYDCTKLLHLQVHENINEAEVQTRKQVCMDFTCCKTIKEYNEFAHLCEPPDE